MISSDFRDEARRKLTGKWGKAACILLAYFLVFFAFGFVVELFSKSASWLFSLIQLLVTLPLSFGLVIAMCKLFDNEEIRAFDFFKFGFNNFSKSWGIVGTIFVKLLIPIIILIVSVFLLSFGIAGASISVITSSSAFSGGFGLIGLLGIILYFVAIIWIIMKSYYYQLSYIVAAENPNLTASEVIKKCENIMQNHRGQLFILQLSFIGWAILAAFTFGIGYLFLFPYIQFACIVFYKKLVENSETIVNNSENSENTSVQ